MSGPCSFPSGASRREYEEMWVMVCDFHKDCTPDSHRVFDKNGEIVFHSFITKREWLFKRNQLRTGKTKN